MAVDREPQEIPGARFVQADIENAPWPLAGEQFEGIVVTNYLHRPLFPVLQKSLKGGGVLIYETFMLFCSDRESCGSRSGNCRFWGSRKGR